MNTRVLLVIILVIVVFGVSFYVGRVSALNGISGVGSAIMGIGDETQTEEEVSREGAQQNGGTEEAGSSATINSSDLTPGQRSLLEAFGVNPDNITITEEMIACAEAKLGAARIEEIKNGAAPSFIEGTRLVECY